MVQRGAGVVSTALVVSTRYRVELHRRLRRSEPPLGHEELAAKGSERLLKLLDLSRRPVRLGLARVVTRHSRAEWAHCHAEAPRRATLRVLREPLSDAHLEPLELSGAVQHSVERCVDVGEVLEASGGILVRLAAVRAPVISEAERVVHAVLLCVSAARA